MTKGEDVITAETEIPDTATILEGELERLRAEHSRVLSAYGECTKRSAVLSIENERLVASLMKCTAALTDLVTEDDRAAVRRRVRAVLEEMLRQ